MNSTPFTTSRLAFAVAAAFGLHLSASAQPVADSPPTAQSQAPATAAPKILVLSSPGAVRIQAGSPPPQPTGAQGAQQSTSFAGTSSSGQNANLSGAPLYPSRSKPLATPKPPPSQVSLDESQRANAERAADRTQAAIKPGAVQQRQPAPPIQSSRVASVAGKPIAAAPPSAGAARPPLTPQEVAEERRRKLEQRYIATRQAQGPLKAGVPRNEGAAGTPAKPPARAMAAAPAAASAPVVAAAPAVAVVPGPPPTGFVLLKNGGSRQPDPVANQLIRAGDAFVFTGQLNGKPVTFKLSDRAIGLSVPAPIAVSHGLVAANSPAGRGTSDVYTPVQSISVGSHPVTAVMARVVPGNGQFVEIGVDALSAFKVVMQDGRRLLVPGDGV